MNHSAICYTAVPIEKLQKPSSARGILYKKEYSCHAQKAEKERLS